MSHWATHTIMQPLILSHFQIQIQIWKIQIHFDILISHLASPTITQPRTFSAFSERFGQDFSPSLFIPRIYCSVFVLSLHFHFYFTTRIDHDHFRMCLLWADHGPFSILHLRSSGKVTGYTNISVLSQLFFTSILLSLLLSLSSSFSFLFHFSVCCFYVDVTMSQSDTTHSDPTKLRSCISFTIISIITGHHRCHLCDRNADHDGDDLFGDCHSVAKILTAPVTTPHPPPPFPPAHICDAFTRFSSGIDLNVAQLAIIGIPQSKVLTASMQLSSAIFAGFHTVFTFFSLRS